VTAKRIGLDEVRASLDPSVKAHYSVAWFGRPIGNLLTPFCYNIGWTANGVTIFRMYLAVVITACLAFPGWETAVVGAVGFYVCFILDCVDGNLARLQTSVTYWGKFIDGLADFIFVQGAPLAAGIGQWAITGDVYWIVIGSAISIMTVTSQMVRARLSFFREWMVSLTGPITDDVNKELEAPRRIQSMMAVVFVNGTFLGPLLLFVPDYGRQLFLLAGLATVFLVEFIWLCATMRESRILLNRQRRSRHSPPEAAANADDAQAGAE